MALEYFLTDEQKMLKELCQRIVEEKIKPIALEYDKEQKFPRSLLEELGKADLFRAFIPEEYEGLGAKVMDLCIVVEELSRGCAGIATSYAACALGTFPIILFGSEEQKKKYLPAVASGEKLVAFCITEPEAGSDASNIKTTAVKKGDSYILNGTKHFISNATEADIYVVIAMTDKSKGPRGASCIIVEKGTEGLSFGKKEDKMGIRSSSTAEVVFQDCKVPRENLLGKEGFGFIITMKTFDCSRPGVGAQAVGIAQGALDAALEYAHQRIQFGRPISSFQGIQWMLAQMATETEAARNLVYAVAKTIDSGSKNFTKESAMAKYYASETAMKVTTQAVQILGGYGYMHEYGVEKMMRDAKITQIYEGTNQIQLNEIASGLIKELLKKK